MGAMTSPMSWQGCAPSALVWILLLATNVSGARAPQESEAGSSRVLRANVVQVQEQDSGSATPDVSEAAAPPTAKEPQPPETPRYRFLDEAVTLFDDWRSSGHVEALTLGPSYGGREIFAVQFGAAGDRALSERTSVFLVGGLDGVSVSGSETVIRLVSKLLESAERLPPEMAFVAIPWANPDGLARWMETGCGGGRNDRPVDDDRDGRMDEDRADDVDGDGQVLEMLIEDGAGGWVHGPDKRVLRPAKVGQAPRYVRTREGEDEDGDGLYNEDEAGGVVTDHNFPVDWRGPWSGVSSGALPMSEKSTRAIVDLARRRRCAVFLAFQGNHGWLASPGGLASAESFVQASDVEAYSFLLDTYRKGTKRTQVELPTQRIARGYERPGTAIDWFYRALGSMSAELAVWGIGAMGEEGVAEREGFENTEEAWARYFDETRGGKGFVPWQPYDLAGGQKALVGGWERNTCINPVPESLSQLVSGLDEFCISLAKGLPQLAFEIVDKSENGRVRQLRARVRNHGLLPSGVGPGGERFGTKVRVLLPPGVELLAGDEEVLLGHVPGQGTSPTFSWLFSAPEGTLFEFVVESRWCPPVKVGERL